jgi:AhpD family alkylhydroperoxidase
MKEPAMECPAEKMKKDENYKRVMLVAAGSAMAASCEPCLNMVIPNLIEVGVPDAEIMKETADVLAGTGFLDKEAQEERVQDEMETLKLDKMSMLIAVGAAVAGNCEPCLNSAVRELKNAGATHEEIRSAVEIGQTVKERPAGIMKETADKLIGGPVELVAPV